MRNLFSSALKDNENLEFGILTGILRIAKESLFSGLNNLVVNTILDDKYSEYFGFTVNDISNMAAYYGMAEKLSEIKEWYDGYLFGNTEIYNPWSVINYFNNNCKPKAFWSRTSGNEIIGELIRSSDKEVYESLSLLLQGKEVQSIINTDIIYPEVNADSDTIYSFLLVAGYLRATNVISEFNDNPICSLKLPNREIKSVFHSDSYFGFVLLNQEKSGYELRMYNQSGDTVFSREIQGDYSHVKMDGDNIILYDGSKCCIYTTTGILKFKGDLGADAQEIFDAFGLNRYYVMSDNELRIVYLTNRRDIWRIGCYLQSGLCF